MAEKSSSIIEAIVKIRQKKKWKKRHCTLQKSTSHESTHAELCIYKNVKCGLKTTRKTEILQRQNFYGLESGFQLDKEIRTLAIICHGRVIVVSFETDYILRTWESWLGSFFGNGYRFSVIGILLPSNFDSLRNTRFRLHLRDDRFCLVHDVPPVIVVELSFRDLRCFGPRSSKHFAVEAGSRAGPYAGVYEFEVGELDHVSWMFQLARHNRLNDYLNRQNYENSFVSTNNEPFSSSYEGSSSWQQRHVFSVSTGAPSSVSCGFSGFNSKGSILASTCSYDISRSQKDAHFRADSMGNHRNSDTDLINGQRSDSAISSSSDTLRHTTMSARQLSRGHTLNHASSLENEDGSTFALISKRSRPTSVCEEACPPRCKIPSKTRPVSEIFSTSTKRDDRVLLPLPELPKACARCRNYVNQHFVESLQDYYNIDHVVLALSKKSKCCDHVCAAENGTPDAEQMRRLLDATAAVKVCAQTEPNSVNVPSKDYAAMAPRGGLYVIMEPISRTHGYASVKKKEVERRYSQSSVPPDDPLHMDESKIVIVPEEGMNNASATRSEVIVKPFEPIVLSRRDSARRRQRRMDQQCERNNGSSGINQGNSKDNSKCGESINCVKDIRHNSLYVGSVSGKDSSGHINSSDNNIWRSASFAAKDAVRSSTRRTREMFDNFARRASSAIFRGGDNSRHGDHENMEMKRYSRTISEPPADLNLHRKDGVCSFPSERRFQRKMEDGKETIDLDEVIYEGVPLRSKTELASKSSNASRAHLRRRLVSTQRSVGADSTVSSSSYSSHIPDYIARTGELSMTCDSSSLMSETSDLDSALYSQLTGRENKAFSHHHNKDFRRFTESGNTHEGRSRNPASGYDGDGSSDSYAFPCASETRSKVPTTSPSETVPAFFDYRYFRLDKRNASFRRSLDAGQGNETRKATYSPPPPLDRQLCESPVQCESDSTKSKSSNKCPPPRPSKPIIEGDVFKFPPPSFVLNDYSESTLLNYATLAMQDIPSLTPTSAVSENRQRLSSTGPSPSMARPVEYLIIDAVATQAARKAVTSQRDSFALGNSSFRTLSDNEQGADAMSRSVISHRSAEKYGRPSALKRGRLFRRLSFASLSGV